MSHIPYYRLTDRPVMPSVDRPRRMLRAIIVTNGSALSKYMTN